jgi:hypothetical protein
MILFLHPLVGIFNLDRGYSFLLAIPPTLLDKIVSAHGCRSIHLQKDYPLVKTSLETSTQT